MKQKAIDQYHMQNLQSDSEEYRFITTGQEKNLINGVNAQRHDANIY